MRIVLPALAPRITGDVVILVPFRKLGELLIMPVIDPSGFWVHRDRVGRFGALAAFGSTFGPPKNEKEEEAAFVGCADGSGFFFGVELKRLIVPDLFGIFGAFFGAGLLAPKIFSVPGRLGTGVSFFLRDSPPKSRLNVPGLFSTFGEGFFSSGFFAAGGLEAPEKEKVDCF